MMSFAYVLIDIYFPSSFSGLTLPVADGHFLIAKHFFRYVYFSFTTLTTLGYGDIHPLSQPAQALTYLEAVAGQFYLTVLVARLVGLHLSKSKEAS